MHELYQVLGVRSGAADDEIKAAFRSLAKQLHPDLRPGDADAERRFRDVARAYETLSDPPSRAAYDAGLARQSSLRRWRLGARATTMLSVFALTVSAGLFWRQLGEAVLGAGEDPAGPAPASASHAQHVAPSVALATPEPSAADAPVVASWPLPAESQHALARADPASKRLAVDVLVERAEGGRVVLPESPSDASGGSDKADQPSHAPARLLAALPGKADGAWRSYRDASFGFALEYPADVLLPGPAGPRDARSFVSRDARARLLVSATLNTNGATPAQHRRSLMEGAYKGAQFDYTPLRGTWFVLSGTLGAEMFYQRVTFACGSFHTWKLVYPLSERTTYDRIVEEMHRRYRHDGGGGRCR